jgi:hypothetical protein
MTGKERIAVALRGGKPDRVPILPIYDIGYVLRGTGRDVREWAIASAAERIRILEDSFLLHREIDGLFIHGGGNDENVSHLRVEKFDHCWRITDGRTGEAWGLLPDGSRCTAAGEPLPKQGGELFRESQIQCQADIDRVVGFAPSVAQIEATGRFGPLRHLAKKYPDRHFSFQTGTPMVFSLNACGGFVEGLTTMKSEPALYRKLLQRHMEHQCAMMAPGRQAGADSTWFTSYYTGADTISPRDYAETIFPCDYEICAEAKRQGLFVLHWYLGDLMPVLDKVMELPMDALVLEQGRKGYDIDPVEIRRRVGDKFCLSGFGFENDYCTFDRAGLSGELQRQLAGAGQHGAFIAGTPIMPPNAQPAAVDYYFAEARRLGKYE